VAGWLGACSEDTPTGNGNRPPNLVAVVVQPNTLVPGGQARVTALANDPDNLPLTYRWSATAGTFADPGVDPTTWTAPDSTGEFWIHLEVSDGEFTVRDSASVTVGAAKLLVRSEIPGAGISLNDGFPIETTPHQFDPLPPGFYKVRLETNLWRYDPPEVQLDLADGDSVTVEFTLADPGWQVLDLGRSDLVEVGGVCFLASGTGILYAARTTTGTGLFNADIDPATGGPNGVLIAPDVLVTEPVAITADGTRVFFVSAQDSLMTARILDFTQDGIVDSVWDFRAVKEDGAFGPAVSTGNEVAYSTSPSTDPPTTLLLKGQFMDSVLVNTTLASNTFGRLPSWEPGEPYLAYEWGGVIWWYTFDPYQVTRGGIVTDDGYNTAPAWSPWGPRHIAVLHGISGGTLTDLRLVLRGSPQFTVLAEGLLDPRFVAWSSVQKSLVLSQNPPGSGPTVWRLFNLPVP
jgi:hypothetical protein